MYVDTIPSHESVLRDMRDWWPTLGQGAIIAGPNYEKDGVRKAVHDFARAEGKSVQLFQEPGTWFIIKN